MKTNEYMEQTEQYVLHTYFPEMPVDFPMQKGYGLRMQ